MGGVKDLDPPKKGPLLGGHLPWCACGVSAKPFHLRFAPVRDAISPKTVPGQPSALGVERFSLKKDSITPLSKSNCLGRCFKTPFPFLFGRNLDDLHRRRLLIPVVANALKNKTKIRARPRSQRRRAQRLRVHI